MKMHRRRVLVGVVAVAALAGSARAEEPGNVAVVGPALADQRVDRPALARQVARAQERLASLPPARESDDVVVRINRSQASMHLAMAQRLMKNRHQLAVAKAMVDAAERSMAVVEKAVQP